MLSTALALQEAAKDAVYDNSSMELAAHIVHNKDNMTNEEVAKAIYAYSAHLASLTATLVTYICLTESQLNEMMDTIKEMDSMGKDITNGNDN